MLEFNVTENAINRIRTLLALETKPVKGLRISVEAGGCSGLKYRYNLTNEIKDSDILVNKDDPKIYLDVVSVDFVQNAQLDFIEELGTSYFRISNPNATSKCGCGSSFGV